MSWLSSCRSRTRPVRPCIDRAGRGVVYAERAVRVRWAARNFRFHRSGVKRFHHPFVGDLTLTYERLQLPADPGEIVFAYTAGPESAS
jgi:hypothetical protein